ncbi:Uncharacterised protein [Serratia proteamaculans]|uniref:hypothetical protein n=1 Tax=Serratia proteamaculans TaxID=28151 RepID=UPI002183B443|nr:hypothetical protein [Serratia proteamaculans]CAI2539480.1 Uncharacterised protein [Serratia proteamaculans]
MTQTLTTEMLQEIYEAAVHVEAVGDEQDACFELLCKLEDVGGTGSTIRKLIDMVRAANREAQPVYQCRFFTTDVDGKQIGEWQDMDKGFYGQYDPYCRRILYTAPPAPAPAVPDAIGVQEAKELFNYLMTEEELNATVNGYNACRADMLNGALIGEGSNKPVKQGYKLVPVEPTEEMIAAAMNCDDVEFNSDETFCVNFDNIYRAMLAAAPEGGNG